MQGVLGRALLVSETHPLAANLQELPGGTLVPAACGVLLLSGVWKGLTAREGKGKVQYRGCAAALPMSRGRVNRTIA